jgi:tetratricopeptide (TPR) repeat protein
MNSDELTGLLEEVKRLGKAYDYLAIEKLLVALPRSVLVAELDLCLQLATVWMRMYRHPEAKKLLRETRRYFLTSGDHVLMRKWKNTFAVALIEEGELARARMLLQESVSSAEEDCDHRELGYATTALGIIACFQGNIEDALRHYGRSMTIWMMLGNRLGVAAVHHNLGVVLREWGYLTEASEHFLKAEEYYSEDGLPEERIFTAVERAMLYLSLGDATLAEVAAERALARAMALQRTHLSAGAAKVLGTILIAVGRLNEARIHLDFAEKESKRLPSKPLRAEIHEELAVLALAEGNTKEAERQRENALSYYSEIGAKNHCSRFDARYRIVHQRVVDKRANEPMAFQRDSQSSSAKTYPEILPKDPDRMSHGHPP